MPAVPPEPLAAWAARLRPVELPVFRATAQAIRALRRDERATARSVSEVVLRDPMFALRVLCLLGGMRRGEDPTEITTVEHAVMMLGLAPFFHWFGDLPVVEERLADQAGALAGLRRVASRSRHAALYARDWARLRRDLESEEVVIAALLHDLPELLLWCFATEQAQAIGALMRRDPALRSAVAQHAVLGFELNRLVAELACDWRLPRLLQTLIDDRQADTPRARNVRIAVALARHSAQGWYDAALPDDYLAIGRLLGIDHDAVIRNVQRVALAAAREPDWYGVPPAAAWLPQLPPQPGATDPPAPA
jgi:HD-like signal output (HDOD) protein